MPSKTTVVGTLNECCKNPKNRFKISENLEAETVTEKCGVCGRHHYRMVCDPILFGVDGRPIG